MESREKAARRECLRCQEDMGNLIMSLRNGITSESLAYRQEKSARLRRAIVELSDIVKLQE
jgi:hypothetical protein